MTSHRSERSALEEAALRRQWTLFAALVVASLTNGILYAGLASGQVGGWMIVTVLLGLGVVFAVPDRFPSKL